MFAVKGIDATTIENMTERADVGKGTFYRHFPNKDAVVAALTRETLSELTDRLRSSKRAFQSLREVVDHLLTVHSAFFAGKASEFLLLFQGRIMLGTHRFSGPDSEAPFADYLEEIRNQIAACDQGKEVDASRIRRLSRALTGFVSTALSFEIIGMPKDRIEASMAMLRQTFVDSCLIFLERESAPAPAAVAGAEKTN